MHSLFIYGLKSQRTEKLQTTEPKSHIECYH